MDRKSIQSIANAHILLKNAKIYQWNNMWHLADIYNKYRFEIFYNKTKEVRWYTTARAASGACKTKLCYESNVRCTDLADKEKHTESCP